jgi:hypothetical protein
MEILWSDSRHAARSFQTTRFHAQVAPRPDRRRDRDIAVAAGRRAIDDAELHALVARGHGRPAMKSIPTSPSTSCVAGGLRPGFNHSWNGVESVAPTRTGTPTIDRLKGPLH